jgi:hypothetical protein
VSRRARAVSRRAGDLAWRRPPLAELVARIMMLLLCPRSGAFSGRDAIRRFVPARTGREQKITEISRIHGGICNGGEQGSCI